MATTHEDTAVVIPAATLVSNDTDAEGDALGVTVVGAATHGTATLAGGSVTFTPEADFFGMATFEYTVSDGASTSTAKVTVTVVPVNDAPTAIADAARMDEDAVLVIPSTTLVANDTDVEGDALSVVAVGAATHGTVALSSDNVTFTPEPDFFGMATFEYTVSDGHGPHTSMVTITVNPVNDAPMGVADAVEIDEDAVMAIPAIVLVANDTDVEGDVLSMVAVGAATHGTVTLAGGDVHFTPEANFHGTAAFEYTVSDGVSTSTSTVTVTVYPVNDAPVAVADSVVADEGVELLVPVATLLANDTDVEGDALTVRQVANVRNGKAVLDGDAVRFTPTPGYVGAASFEYQVSDTHGATATGSVALRVRAYAPRSVVAGAGHTCALFPDGRVKCWGGNFVGQLGLGLTGHRGDDPGEMGDALPFVQLGTGQKATALGLGDRFTCALLASGAIKCWGINNSGQLGLGDTAHRGDGPGEMGDTLPPVALGTGRTAKALAVGGSHACALLDDGAVKCWGYNVYGQLGLGDRQTHGDGPGEMGDALPAVDLGTGRTAKALIAGSTHSCALLDDDTVKCWGENADGNLGLGDTRNRGDNPDEMGDALPAVDLGAGRTAKALTIGQGFTCASLDDGSVKCWGANGYGQLGLGDMENRGDGPGEMGDALPPVDFGTGRTAKALSAGMTYTCALLDNATVKCWGVARGSLGLGDTARRGDEPGEMGDALPPVDLGTGRTATSLAAGTHTCATFDDGAVKCWGDNTWGQLGLGHGANRGEKPNEMGDALPAIEL
ncbi:Ig-like domain-containing protein [Myxococcus stipitatus]|nr:Ig-like domain-containing protein [Myxococcus stipitatus]